MHLSSYPFTVRLIGFTPGESARLEALLARAPGVGPSYSCLHDDSLQEPDLYIANGDSPTALTRLGCLPPGSLQPALVIVNPGDPGAAPWRTLARPVDPVQLHETLAELLDTRVQVLVQQSTRTVRRVLAERRRRPRLAPDCETPAFYTRQRRGPVDGAVLIVDKECKLRNQVALLIRLGQAVERADNTARLLDVKYHILLPEGESVGGVVDRDQWTTILQTVSAVTAYRWLYSDGLTPASVIDLLLSRTEMPRSLAAASEEVVDVLGLLARNTGRHGEADRMARARVARIGRTRTGEVIVSGLHQHLQAFIAENAQLHAAIGRQFTFV